jgi:6-phosphogluconolactonase
MKLAAASGRTATRRIQVSENYDALCRVGAEHFVQTVIAAITREDRAAVALSGGNTPRGLYSLLATEPYRVRVPWEKVHVFWGDERCVPPDDAQSNYRMAHEALLAHVPIPAENVRRMRGEGPDLEQAARDYEAEIRAFFHKTEALPVFDLIHLGMGDDGHTASLFPHTAGLSEGSRLVIVNRVEKLDSNRLTFTYPLLNAAANVVFLVSGDSKTAVLKDVLEGPYQPIEHPSEGVQPAEGVVTWLIDKAAAAGLSPETLSRR